MNARREDAVARSGATAPGETGQGKEHRQHTTPHRSGAIMSAVVADLAPAIRAEHEAAQTSARQVIAHAIRAGELLLQVKDQLPHGAFGPWLTANVEFSYRTAQGYMQLARECADPAKAQRVADLSLRGALRELSPAANVRSRLAPMRLITDGLRAPDAGPSIERGTRSFHILRNKETKQWCLRALRDDNHLFTETFYFSPMDETTDCKLLTFTTAVLVDYFLEKLGDLEIEDISLRGDCRDLGSAGILAHSRPLRVKGWTRLGFEA